MKQSLIISVINTDIRNYSSSNDDANNYDYLVLLRNIHCRNLRKCVTVYSVKLKTTAVCSSIHGIKCLKVQNAQLFITTLKGEHSALTGP